MDREAGVYAANQIHKLTGIRTPRWKNKQLDGQILYQVEFF